MQIREKVHAAVPMTLEQALYEMELVGHDFYLFCDAESRRPSVVYRRRGWEYGVLHLDVDHSAVGAGTAHSQRLGQAAQRHGYGRAGRPGRRGVPSSSGRVIVGP